jgi:excinuclease UvrABC nuclease subunit
MTYVYRAYDDDGRLLYVGLTDYVEHRMRAHLRAGSLWLDHLAQLVVEKRRNAAAAEREAIKTEWPLYNVQHSFEGPRTPPHLKHPEGPASPEQLLERERRVAQALRAAGFAHTPRLIALRFLREVDPFDELPEPERLRRAMEARRAYHQRRALASVEGKRKAREARKAAMA